MTIQGAQRPGAALYDDAPREYDALLVLSFGGPEGMADVMPFLENVTRGRGVPRQRLAEVAEHYAHYDGISPINAQNRALIAALERELSEHQIALPIYFGNRNWHPLLADTLARMEADGARNVLVFVTSAYGSYSGCRQYREDIIRAVNDLGATSMRFDKIRVFFNHPGFIEPMSRSVQLASESLANDRGAYAEVIFTAHSIPLSMARGSAYERQLREACRLVAERAGVDRWQLAWQSRSGPPHVPWLEPDVLDVLDEIANNGATDAIVVPIGFISDHLEVLFDLDVEARQRAGALGMNLIRVPTVGTDPTFVAMIRELIVERLIADPVRRGIGALAASHDICPLNCCLIDSGRKIERSVAVRATA